MSLNIKDQAAIVRLLRDFASYRSLPEKNKSAKAILERVEAIAAAAFETGVEAASRNIEAAKRANPYGIALDLVEEFQKTPAQSTEFVLKKRSTKTGMNCTCERIFLGENNEG